MAVFAFYEVILVLNVLLRELAPVLALSWVVVCIVAVLAAWAGWSAVRLWSASSRLTDAFGEATRAVSSDTGEAGFAAGYETCSATLAALPLIGPSWAGFRQTLVIPPSPGRSVAATSDPRDWFDLAGLFRSAGADLRYHAALPGLLVGAGLMVTFLGLAAALTAASDVVAEGVAQSERNAALRTLLGAASVKFVTSLAGLFLSIVYALFRKWRVRSVEQAFAAFAAALHARMPFRTAASLQAEANALLEKQNTEIQRIGTDFFVNLGATLEHTFDNGLAQHIGPLAEAVAGLSNRLATQNQNAMGSMMDAFLTRLEGAVGKNMGDTAAILSTLGERLGGVQAGMDLAAERMSKAAQEMASGMGKGAAEGVAQLTAPIEALLHQLRDLSASQRDAGTEAARELAATVARSADALEATGAKVAGILGGGAQDAAERLVAATEAMSRDLRAVLERFGETLGDGGRSLAQGAEAGGASIRDAATSLGGDMIAIAARLEQAGAAAGAALRDGAAEAQGSLTRSADALATGGASLAERLSALGAASASLAERTQALDRAAGSVESPLTAAAADLRAAALAAQTASAPLRDSAEGLASAAAALAASQREAEALAGRLTEAAARFAGLDDNLARTMRSLGEGLNGYQDSISRFVTDIDKGFARSAEHLTGVAKELTDTVEDFHRKPNGRSS